MLLIKGLVTRKNPVRFVKTSQKLQVLVTAIIKMKEEHKNRNNITLEKYEKFILVIIRHFFTQGCLFSNNAVINKSLV